jgi:methenyltetrahydromethanopterin cyclohydrolase
MADGYYKKITYEDKYIDPLDLVKAGSTNAQLWGKSFMDKIKMGQYSRSDIDEGLMISWFASAIETAKDSVARDNRGDNEDEWLR